MSVKNTYPDRCHTPINLKASYRLRHISYLLLAAAALCGCVNTKQVSIFATAAAKSAASYQRLPYSFQQNCLANCRENNISALAFNADSCDCTLAVKADSVNNVIYNAVQSYLEGVVALSDGDLTTFKYSGLTGELQAEKLGGINITDAQAGAYAKLAGIITNAVANGYRKNKLKQYIREADPYFSTLINGLKFNIAGSLAQSAATRKVKLKGDYYRLMNDKTNTGFEKREIIKAYYRETDALDKAIASLNAYGKLLGKICADHQNLSAHLLDADNKQVAGMVAGYISEIKNIDRQLNIILK